MKSSRKYRVLIVDDHPIVRRGVADLVAREPDLEVCGEAADVDEALQQVETASPDIAVIDISLRSGHGLELIKQIKALNNGVKMLVSSVHDELLFAERSLRAGAAGYLPKQESTEHLLDAIRRVLRGEVYLTPRMSNRLLPQVACGKAASDNPVQALSNRELEVFQMIGQGLNTQDISQALQLSNKTIETHREKIKRKLNLRNSAELARRAVQWELEHH